MNKKLDLSSIGTLNPVLDSVEFVKRAWSSFNLPTSFAPTMDVEELDKRIADLKAVEQWLNVNLSMLKGTIQALEIQRGTLAAMKAFGNAVTTSGDSFVQIAQAERSSPTRAPEVEPAAAPPKPRPARRARAKARAGATGSRSPLAAVGDAVNPSTWWNLLQGQFNQVAQAALSGSGISASEPEKKLPPAPAGKSRAASRRKKRPASGAKKQSN